MMRMFWMVSRELRSLWGLLPILLLWLLTGCSNAGSGASLPTVAYSSPAADSSEVSILSTVSVTLSKAVAPDSVNSTTVQLASDEGTVSGSVTYDEATHTITFTPWSLDYAQTYTLTLNGITNPVGRMMAIETVQFSTFVNPVDSHVSYSRDFDGAIRGYQTEEYDDQGQVFRTIYYDSSGADAVWQTSDDRIGHVTLYEYQDNADGNRVSRQLVFTDSGADGQWLTADDQFSWANEYWREEEVSQTREFSVNYFDGGDGEWQSADDEIVDYDKVEMQMAETADGQERSARMTSYVTAGDDGLWLTEDDVIGRYALSVEARSGSSTSGYSIYYIGAGEDGIWLTVDDEAIEYLSYTADEQLARAIRYGDAGSDGYWITEDDVVESYFVRGSVQSESGASLTTSAYYDAAGADGEWFTADDNVMWFSSYQFDEELQRATTINYSDVGADGQVFTDDDSIVTVSISSLSRDENAEVYLRINYDGPGTDGVWLTEDDDIERYEEQTKDAAGNRVSDKASIDSGVDGEWLTDDDLFIRVIDYDTSY